MKMKKVVFGFAGEMGSGKGTAAKYIINKYNAAYFRGSDIIRNILDRLYLKQKRENFSLLSETLRKAFGQDLLGKVIAKDVEKAKEKIIIVDGIRRLTDIKYLKELPNFNFFYIDATLKTRYERLIKRNENVGDSRKTFDEFKKDHQLETELQIPGLKNHADYVVDNGGTTKNLYNQLDKIINKLKK